MKNFVPGACKNWPIKGVINNHGLIRRKIYFQTCKTNKKSIPTCKLATFTLFLSSQKICQQNFVTYNLSFVLMLNIKIMILIWLLTHDKVNNNNEANIIRRNFGQEQVEVYVMGPRRSISHRNTNIICMWRYTKIR